MRLGTIRPSAALPARTLAAFVVTAAILAPHASLAQRPTVGVIGTGAVANAAGPRWGAAGYEVVYGSRDPSRASVRALVERTGSASRATTQREAAAEADVILLAVQWQVMREVVDALGDVRGKILLDVSGSDRPGADGYMEAGVETSTSQVIQGWVPEARVVKVGIPSAYLVADPDLLGEPPTVMLAADDREAKETAAELVAALGLDPWDAGPLRMAESIEAVGRLFWTPLLQGRPQGVEFRLMRSSYWPCMFDAQAAFGVPDDADDLAEMPAQGEPLPCETFEPPGG